jgi:hypothetical protein
MHIRSEQVRQCREYFNFKVEFDNLPKAGVDPTTYMEIRRENERGEFEVAYRTPKILSRNPIFHVEVSGQQLCNGDMRRKLKIQLYRFRVKAMESDFGGELDVTAGQLKVRLQVQLTSILTKFV